MAPDLYCAVPEHYPVPGFIVGEAWDFGGRLDDYGAAPRGFDPAAASHGVGLSGYYLFLAETGIAPHDDAQAFPAQERRA